MPTTVLLPQVLDKVKIPVIAAGGMADGRGLAAALAYGAVGIAMGTRFLLTRESPAPDNAKAAYLQAGTDGIVLTTKIDGMPQRMIPNEYLAMLEKASPLKRLRIAIGLALHLMRRGLRPRLCGGPPRSIYYPLHHPSARTEGVCRRRTSIFSRPIRSWERS